MIISMTGFGRASRNLKNMTISVEMRSVNSKFLEITSRLPLLLADKEAEVKEIVSKSISRGKVYVSISAERKSGNEISLQVQPEVVKHYYSLLAQIKKAVNLKEDIKFEHLLKFSEIFKTDENGDIMEHWEEVKKVTVLAIKDLYTAKLREGKILERDILSRINHMEKKLNSIIKISDKNIKDSKKKLMQKVLSLIGDKTLIDNNRLEFELVMLTDKMDITEEVIRAKSHLSYFKKNMKETELSGRRLNFLVQEINREINTIASKSGNSSISQSVVEMKEELEKVKEQLQNVE
jgi:uncharacterized protein (TIGR00255 family)